MRRVSLDLRAPSVDPHRWSDRAKQVHLRMHFVHEARAAGHLQLHKIER